MLELNLKNNAISQTTVTFNSMCKFGDIYLGADSTGLHKIHEFADGDTEISALMSTGIFDLGTERSKRIAYIYLGVETSGDLQIEVWCDGEYKVTLDVPHPGAGYQEATVKVPRGLVARYWQLKFKNVDGSFFVLYSVKLLPVVLQSAK